MAGNSAGANVAPDDNERMELRDVIAQALRDFDYGHGVGKSDGWEWEDAADLIIERTKHHEHIDGGGYSSCCECTQDWPCSYSGITRWPTIITGVHQRQCEYTLPMDGGHPFTKEGIVYEGKIIDRFTWPDGVVTKARVTTVEDGHSEAYGDERRVVIEEAI